MRFVNQISHPPNNTEPTTQNAHSAPMKTAQRGIGTEWVSHRRAVVIVFKTTPP